MTYYNPYEMYQNQRQQVQMQTLPPMQVIQVNDRQSAQSIRMAPNSSVLVMDKSLPIVYLCVSDGLGGVTTTAYDIAVHQEKPPVDLSALEDKIVKLENMLNGLEEKLNGKSNDSSFTTSKNFTGNANVKTAQINGKS